MPYLKLANLDEIQFEEITPDKYNNWLNQSNSDFDNLLPLATRETKFAKSESENRPLPSWFVLESKLTVTSGFTILMSRTYARKCYSLPTITTRSWKQMTTRTIP